MFLGVVFPAGAILAVGEEDFQVGLIFAVDKVYLLVGLIFAVGEKPDAIVLVGADLIFPVGFEDNEVGLILTVDNIYLYVGLILVVDGIHFLGACRGCSAQECQEKDYEQGPLLALYLMYHEKG